MLFSHTEGFIFSKTIEILCQSGSATPSLETVRFIAEKVLPNYATGRVRDIIMEWNAQLDQTQQLEEFDQLCFKEIKLFLVPFRLSAILDDELYGTRAAEKQVINKSR